MVEIEIWEEMPGQKNYLISNCGRIKTRARTIELKGRWGMMKRSYPEMIRKLSRNKYPNGYLMIVFADDSPAYVHRMVAQVFVSGQTKERCFVNHIDGNKENNHFKNLEWVTKKENAIHAQKNGLLCKETQFGGKRSNSKNVKNVARNTGVL